MVLLAVPHKQDRIYSRRKPCQLERLPGPARRPPVAGIPFVSRALGGPEAPTEVYSSTFPRSPEVINQEEPPGAPVPKQMSLSFLPVPRIQLFISLASENLGRVI